MGFLPHDVAVYSSGNNYSIYGFKSYGLDLGGGESFSKTISLF
jgi:hypothetical protein